MGCNCKEKKKKPVEKLPPLTKSEINSVETTGKDINLYLAHKILTKRQPITPEEMNFINKKVFQPRFNKNYEGTKEDQRRFDYAFEQERKKEPVKIKGKKTVKTKTGRTTKKKGV